MQIKKPEKVCYIVQEDYGSYEGGINVLAVFLNKETAKTYIKQAQEKARKQHKSIPDYLEAVEYPLFENSYDGFDGAPYI